MKTKVAPGQHEKNILKLSIFIHIRLDFLISMRVEHRLMVGNNEKVHSEKNVGPRHHYQHQKYSTHL